MPSVALRSSSCDGSSRIIHGGDTERVSPPAQVPLWGVRNPPTGEWRRSGPKGNGVSPGTRKTDTGLGHDSRVLTLHAALVGAPGVPSISPKTIGYGDVHTEDFCGGGTGTPGAGRGRCWTLFL